ncbi:MAG: hypothetical protein JNM84_28330 [Planctomycetes bacterium]|nr:hypothetical protein [Planctomycetota bacterium]
MISLGLALLALGIADLVAGGLAGTPRDRWSIARGIATGALPMLALLQLALRLRAWVAEDKAAGDEAEEARAQIEAFCLDQPAERWAAKPIRQSRIVRALWKARRLAVLPWV